jgi:CheY-like chemotaxis protein
MTEMASATVTIDAQRTAEELFKVLQDRARRSHYYDVIRDLRLLAVMGALDKKGCTALLEHAEEISATEADDEIMMDVIGSVASSPMASLALPPFIERCVDDDEKRWFGFFAVGSMVNRNVTDFTDSFRRTIVSAAMDEPDAERRTRYVELAGNILLRGYRVVVVDPDVGFVTFAEKQLSDKGAFVQTASSSEAALEIAKTHKEPDVWVAAIDLVNNLREQGSKAPIVGVTKQDPAEERKKQLGVRIMLKPVTPADLRLAVANEIFHRNAGFFEFGTKNLDLLKRAH